MSDHCRDRHHIFCGQPRNDGTELWNNRATCFCLEFFQTPFPSLEIHFFCFASMRANDLESDTAVWSPPLDKDSRAMNASRSSGESAWTLSKSSCLCFSLLTLRTDEYVGPKDETPGADFRCRTVASCASCASSSSCSGVSALNLLCRSA